MIKNQKFNKSSSKIATVANPIYNIVKSKAVLTSVPTVYQYDALGRVINRTIDGSANVNTYT